MLCTSYMKMKAFRAQTHVHVQDRNVIVNLVDELSTTNCRVKLTKFQGWLILQAIISILEEGPKIGIRKVRRYREF